MTPDSKGTATRAIAIHEAGHAVVAHALGFDVVCIEDHEDGPRCGFLIPGEPSEMEHFLLAAVSLAGGQAESMDGGTPDFGSMQDLDEAAGHAEEFAGADGIDATMLRAVTLAANILRGQWKTVESIVQRIHETGCDLDADDLAACFGAGAEFRMVHLHEGASP